MNTLADIVAFSREHAGRHIHEPDRAWRISGTAIAAAYVLWMLGAYALSGVTTPMLDVLFVLLTISFFALALAYVAGCERLMR